MPSSTSVAAVPRQAEPGTIAVPACVDGAIPLPVAGGLAIEPAPKLKLKLKLKPKPVPCPCLQRAISKRPVTPWPVPPYLALFHAIFMQACFYNRLSRWQPRKNAHA